MSFLLLNSFHWKKKYLKWNTLQTILEKERKLLLTSTLIISYELLPTFSFSFFFSFITWSHSKTYYESANSLVLCFSFESHVHIQTDNTLTTHECSSQIETSASRVNRSAYCQTKYTTWLQKLLLPCNLPSAGVISSESAGKKVELKPPAAWNGIAHMCIWQASASSYLWRYLH